MFHYPILPEPPCFPYLDGSRRESKIASALHLMKGNINSSIASDDNAVEPFQTSFLFLYLLCYALSLEKD